MCGHWRGQGRLARHQMRLGNFLFWEYVHEQMALKWMQSIWKGGRNGVFDFIELKERRLKFTWFVRTIS